MRAALDLPLITEFGCRVQRLQILSKSAQVQCSTQSRIIISASRLDSQRTGKQSRVIILSYWMVKTVAYVAEARFVGTVFLIGFSICPDWA